MAREFERVGIRPLPPAPPEPQIPWYRGRPWASILFLGLLSLACLFCDSFLPHDPGYMDLANVSKAPCREFLFGTDPMGRDIFSMIFSGGRLSLAIGLLATALSTALAVLVGALSGWAPAPVDGAVMRLTEILLSVPSLLVVVLIQAVLGKATVLSISLVLGLTGWMSMAKVVRAEVRRIREGEYVAAARAMGGRFFYVLFRHLAPNFWSSILFMVVMNVRSAMMAEATLSFMGLGLPLEVISWGSMLSLAEKALLTGAWWIILIPGLFLVLTLLAITNLADALRRDLTPAERNL